MLAFFGYMLPSGRLPNGDFMKTNQSIRDVYQILRDRFVVKPNRRRFLMWY